ncbi:hypothetical protein LTR95_003035 [Oleoguttula sp. CCFEE 5521]
MPIATRRTHRQHHYHSNGRDYLASLLDWPSGTILEDFLRSDAVLPHLQHWLRLCYETPHRFQEAVEWINTGPQGYHYTSGDLEEDLLLECLGYGVGEDGRMGDWRWDDEGAETGGWITLELWARTVWRAVRDSSRQGGWLEGRREVEAYGFVSEILCITFHSLAFRGKKSYYWGIIVGESRKTQMEWENGREMWEERFGKPVPGLDARSIMDGTTERGSEESESEVGSEGMATTLSVLSDAPTEPGTDENLVIGSLLDQGAVEDLALSPPAEPDAEVMAWRDGGENMTSGLAEFDDLAAILNEPDEESRIRVEPITPVSMVRKVRRGIERPDLDAPRSQIVGGRVLRARK